MEIKKAVRQHRGRGSVAGRWTCTSSRRSTTVMSQQLILVSSRQRSTELVNLRRLAAAALLKWEAADAARTQNAEGESL